MSFHDFYLKNKDPKGWDFENRISDDDILRAIDKEKLSINDFKTLLSEKAEKHLERMAHRSNQVTAQHFGKIIFIYTPMYLSNYCVNQCIYCSFNRDNTIKRKKLSMHEIEEEAKAIWSKGIRHILILTGESREESPVSYIGQAVEVLKKYFSSISIEIYPLEEWEYKELIDKGVDGLTIYQEVYDKDIYKSIHLKGPKTKYEYRLDAPERAASASMRTINIGALLGLDDFREEIFKVGLHAAYLQDKYPEVEMGISLPRIRPHVGHFIPKCDVTDKNLVQSMVALRLFMPRLGITISTREESEFRDNLIGLGVTKMSADSCTRVGGHSDIDSGDGQFEIADSRDIEEIKDMILKKGYDPVFTDWQMI